MGPGACQCQILVIWGPCEPPMLVAPQAQAENLKTAGSRCAASTLRKLVLARLNKRRRRRRGLLYYAKNMAMFEFNSITK